MTARPFRIALGMLIIAIELPAPGPAARPAADRNGGAVEIQMRNVGFRVARDIQLEVRALRGRLRPTKPGGAVTLDDRESFYVEIDTGEIAITAASLSALMNSYVFAYPGAPIKNMRVSIDGSRLIEKGTLHKGVDLPFEIDGSVSPSPGGDIRVHADKIKSGHIPLKGLLHLFGARLSKLVNRNAGRGVRIEGDDQILSPRTATPAPHLEGRVAQAALRDGRIVLVFASGRQTRPLHPPLQAEAYIYHRGGVLRFGKLTMNDADLELVDEQDHGLFDFYLRGYKRQLIAGYSKNTAADGLVVHMPGFDRLGAATASGRKP